MEREVRIQQSFNKMQESQRNKDIDPMGYRRAKVSYHRQAEGEAWVAAEEARLRAEASQTTASWKNQYVALQGLRATHQTNLDIVRGAETSGVGDDFKYAVGELRRLIDRDKDSAALAARESYLYGMQLSPPQWALYTMDGIIVLLLLLFIWMLYTRFALRWTATSALINYQKLRTSQRQIAESLRQQLS